MLKQILAMIKPSEKSEIGQKEAPVQAPDLELLASDEYPMLSPPLVGVKVLRYCLVLLCFWMVLGDGISSTSTSETSWKETKETSVKSETNEHSKTQV